MLRQPLSDHGLAALISYKAPHGLMEIHKICMAAFSFALVMGARIWRECYLVLTSWPYRLGDLGSDVPEVRESCVDDLFASRKCCLDADASLKVRARRQVDVRTDPKLLSTFRVWRRRRRFTNMHTERGLKRVMGSAPKRCVAARQIASSFLSAIFSDHLRAGGHDPRKILRRQCIVQGAPIRAATGVRKRRKRDQTHEEKWMCDHLKVWKQRTGNIRNPRAEYVQERQRLKELYDGGSRCAPSFSFELPENEAEPLGFGPDQDESSCTRPRYEDGIGNNLWLQSSESSPLDVGKFMAAAQEMKAKSGGTSSSIDKPTIGFCNGFSGPRSAFFNPLATSGIQESA